MKSDRINKERQFLLVTIFGLAIPALFISSCQKLNPERILRVETFEATQITDNSALLSGAVADDGGLTITAKGICWGLQPEPDVDGLHIEMSGGKGEISQKVTGLESATSYYARAFASTASDTYYADQVVFITTDIQCPATVTDYDGNVYPVIQIGNQCWTQKNLAVTHLSDGNALIKVESNSEWIGASSSTSSLFYCYYDNQTSYKTTYGAFYNFHAVNSQKLCPSGWHVPNEAEWIELIDYLGGTEYAGGKLKQTGTLYWEAPNEGATNESGFTGLPGGRRDFDNGAYVEMGQSGYFWSSSGAKVVPLHFDARSTIYPGWGFGYNSGFSIRCIKND